jgi:hypothetical protein
MALTTKSLKPKADEKPKQADEEIVVSEPKNEQEPEASEPKKAKSSKTLYEVIRALSYKGVRYFGKRELGNNKIIPADVVEMTEHEAKAYGVRYLKKVSK